MNKYLLAESKTVWGKPYSDGSGYENAVSLEMETESDSVLIGFHEIDDVVHFESGDVDW